MQNEEFIQDFKDEASGHLETVEKGLLAYDSGDYGPDVIHDIFRAVHSIKGTAGFFGLNHIVKLSHAMEHLFDRVRKQALTIHGDMITCLLAAADFLKEMVANAERSDSMDIAELLVQIAVFESGTNEAAKAADTGPKISEAKASAQAPEKPPEIAAADGPLPAPASSQPADMVAVRERDSTKNTGTHDESPEAEYTGAGDPDAEEAAGESESKSRLVARASDDTVRVHVSLLNDLLNITSEMVLGRNQLLSTLRGYRKTIPGLNGVLQNMNRLTTELQGKILLTRMQPVDRIFSKFPRVIRELSKKLGKSVELEIEGADVEMDKSLIELLGDPLTHLVRNAVDHGLELPGERERLGKPRTGKIRLKAYHEGGQVNIEIADDGAGIHFEKIEASAIRKQLLTKQEAARMGERDLLALLFAPGFSTAAEVTDVSGRGVGLDVVKVNVEKLGGAVDIMTKPGEGTTFRLTLPLTVAIIPALIVSACGQNFALPQVNLHKMIRIKPGDPERKIDRLMGRQVLRYGDKLLPLIRLSEVLGIEGREEAGEAADRVQRVLVLKSGYKKYGLFVDGILDDEEILVKPLPRLLGECVCYSGVTILGDGHTAMILDTEGIARKAGLRFTDEKVPEAVSGDDQVPLSEAQKLMLFGCSGPETFCVDLSLIARVEKIVPSQIEEVGDKEFVQIRGQAIRVIRPERYLPVQEAPPSGSHMYVLVPKLVKHPIGLLIHYIRDTVETDIRFNRDDIIGKGLVGSAILKGRLTLLLNLYELFEMAAPEFYEYTVEPISEKRTLLLVEDTPFFSRLEKSYLESAGYRVLTAVNGKEAWQLLGEHEVDAIVSDIQMPVMDGLELVKRVRAHKGLAGLPVIAVTSYADGPAKQIAMEAGFDFYEHKLDKGRLLDTVQAALGKGREAG